ncbi:hypothetical protein VTN77DRAFT_2798 [Rasamsonia byssochlamydoides]|uniref:uncharacterized protein n=1 Tax=Rasamsonia byssochlamydoides TaxID=89139 RepID=UPI003742E1C6
MTSFFDLSFELILRVADHLEYHDVSNLSKTCVSSARILRSRLGLSSLPSELILCIADYLDYHDVSSLSKTCVGFARTLRSSLRRIGLRLALPSREEYLKFIDLDSNPPTVRAPAPSVPQPRALLCEAVSVGKIGAVRSFLDLGVDPNSFDIQGLRLLHLAILYFKDDVAKLLLQRGADPSLAVVCDPRTTPLSCAAICADDAMVRHLVSVGADVQQPGVIHPVVRHCDAQTVQYVVSHGANVFEIDPGSGANVLHSAAKNEHLGVVDVLLESGLNNQVNATNNAGKTPLLKALRSLNEEAAESLLAAGADINVVDPSSGNTTLALAASMGMPFVTAAILDKGAAVDAVGLNGRTALHMAAGGTTVDVVEVLLDYGADPDLPDNVGMTALHIAATQNNGDQFAIVQALLKADADVGVRDAFNMSPLDLALDSRHLYIAYLLETEDPFIFDRRPPRCRTWDEYLFQRYAIWQ